MWIDLREPTPEEEQFVESTLGIDVPTREEMREIEASNRFYEENGGLYMTATLVTKLDTDLPERTQVTFILAGSKLVTNRYTDPLPFRRFIAYAARHTAVATSGATVLAGSARGDHQSHCRRVGKGRRRYRCHLLQDLLPLL